MRRGVAIGVAALVAAAGLGLWAASGGDETARVETAVAAPGLPDDALVAVSLPDELDAQAQMGQRAFDAICAACHGTNAAGREGVAPPLIHPYYEPGHHGDAAIQAAVANGVQGHHWPFGNMPPIEGLTRADVANIIAYIRALQRENGIS